MTEHWHLQGAKAQVACGPLLAELDVERPMLGLRIVRLSVETVDGWLMGVDVSRRSIACRAGVAAHGCLHAAAAT